MRRRLAIRRHLALLSIRAAVLLAVPREEPLLEPLSEQSAAMRGAVRRLAPRWAALLAQPAGAHNVRQDNATDQHGFFERHKDEVDRDHDMRDGAEHLHQCCPNPIAFRRRQRCNSPTGGVGPFGPYRPCGPLERRASSVSSHLG
jgi:hypothetical protein